MLSLSKKLLVSLFLVVGSSAYAQDNCSQLSQLLSTGNVVKAAELADQLSIDGTNAQCLNHAGEAYLRKGQTTKALSYFEHALAKASNNEVKANSLNKIALAAWSTGDNSKALEHMLLALELRSESQSDDILAATYNDLGLVQSTSDLDASLDNYLKALKLYESNEKTGSDKIAQVKINIGVIYRKMEFYGDAINNFNEALKLSQQTYPDGHSTQGFIYFNLGRTYETMGNTESAMGFYEKALGTYKNIYGDKHPDVARAYNSLGNTVNRQGEFENALNYYQKALIANSSSFNSENLEQNPAIDSYLSANTLMNSLYFKAQALEDYHFNFSLDFKDLKLSLSTLYACDSLIDEMRRITTNEADKISLSALSSSVYENGVRISYAMADLSFKKDEYFQHAFYFAEKSKSAVLLEAISDASAKSFASIPVEELEKEDYYQSEIAFYEQKLSERNKENEDTYRKALFNLKQEYQSFIKNLESKYPKYFDLKYNVGIPSVEQIQETLDDKTAVMSYFIADATSRVYVFQITNRKLKVDNVNQTENFNRYLNGFRNSIYFKDSEIYQLTGEELYPLLFPSSPSKNVEHLVIIPSGRLGTIPFEALLTDNTKSKNFNYSELPYLINQQSVSYQYAAALYYQYANSTRTSTSNAALLCAPVQFTTLQDLPGTSDEVKELEGIFTGQGIEPDLLIEANATEQIFKSKKLNNYKYLHFATHGAVNEFKPELSRIYLRQSESEKDDGNLYSGEIYNLNLNAELVTLSACETGLGKISKGEGIIGLSRALVYAGAENIIVSLWKVADNSTSKLMTDFYSNLGSLNYNQSLRNAKLDMQKGAYSHPFYWAPFILIGK